MAGKPLDNSERAHLPEAAPPTNHGHTLAAWVTVAMVMVGAALSAAGLLAQLMWLFWLGLGVIVAGAVVGRVLKAFGLGQPEPSGPARGSSASGSDVGPARD